MGAINLVQLKDICNFEKGNVGLAKAEAGRYPLVTTGAERKTCNTYQFNAKAVCIPLVFSTGHGHASLKNVHYQEGKFALGTILVALTSKDKNRLNIQFLHLYLSQLKDQILVPLMSGAANVALSVTKIKNIEIPLPSVDRQQEIVDNFKSVETEDAELKTELTHQQTLLKKLRQQILQEAIEGKLTEEFRIRNDELREAQLQILNNELREATDAETIRNLKLKISHYNASALLECIQAEKAQLIKDKKIRKGKPLPPISEDEKPFDLPEGWVWCRLNNIFNFIDYRGKTPNKLKNGVRLITARNVKIGRLSIEPEDFISIEEYSERMTRGFPKEGDILFTTEAPLGNACILNFQEEISTGQRLITFQGYSPEIENEIFLFFILSPFYQEFLVKKATGMTAKGIKASKLKEMLIPFPPLPEQKAIVAKVEKLLALCDQLESQITNNQNHANALMQAVLKEAFTANNDQSNDQTEQVTAHA